jgi:hypothetical protein
MNLASIGQLEVTVSDSRNVSLLALSLLFNFHSDFERDQFLNDKLIVASNISPEDYPSAQPLGRESLGTRAGKKFDVGFTTRIK